MGQFKRQHVEGRRRELVPIETIVDMLGARALELCQKLLPGGVREGPEWRVGSLAGEPGRSMAVHLSGSKAGVWSDFASGECGDALDLVAQVLFRGNKVDAIKWARGWLGLDGTDPDSLKATRRAIEAREKRLDEEPSDEELRRAAFRIFLSAQERLAGTPVMEYLRGRGLDLALLGRQPRALRFHPKLWCDEARRHFPAMVAAVVDGAGKFVAVHRTWLERQSDGRVVKAPLLEPKKTLGRYRGGAIHLWRGASGKRISEAPPGSALDLTEGIEDGLSVALRCPELRVWAAVATANMRNLVLPPAIEEVVIWAQNDPPGSRAALSLEKACAAFHAQGKRVRLARPPEGVKDVNDVVRGQR